MTATTGPAGRASKGLSSEQFVEATLEMIAEAGGSQGVNLREVSRRVGCAHTNAYNYFADLDDLTMHAFRRVLGLYVEHLATGLDDELPRQTYLHRLVTNLATFPQLHPGWYRFIDTDPIDMDRVPADVFETVLTVKAWLLDVFTVLCGPGVAAEDVEDLCNITTAYIDGEAINLINARVVPGEDVAGRIVDNAMRLFDWHAAACGPPAADLTEPTSYPRLELPVGHEKEETT